ncbi:uncharacterized protein LOC114469896 isoform X1 [Gouania willdenowi]|uniref:Uncharacterized LOC114469896 n=1 Tax=Gouania willdenowi TaxID=441366 RepID=A0A8C5I7G3_GOUWI|nr:uncharacterized protein LOC114469896 isoform X1 [Gouania willdenowi]
MVAVGKGLVCFQLLFFAFIRDVSGFQIRNKLLNKCLQIQAGSYGGRVSMEECRPNLPLQEWRWVPESQALSSQYSGECLTAPREQYEGVHLQACVSAGGATVETDLISVASSQAWACSKKGHLTLAGKGLHLNAAQHSTLVFLSKEHKQGSRWRTFDNKTLCSDRANAEPQTQTSHQEEGAVVLESFSVVGLPDANFTEPTSEARVNPSSSSTKPLKDDNEMFFNMVYGMGWKITMMVLSSLALVVGIVVLIVSVYFNRRRKKVVCVLKSYSPRAELSAPGSPGRSETAPLTEHAMRLPYSTPTVQQGEILIQWKDGTVTPLYEA